MMAWEQGSSTHQSNFVGPQVSGGYTYYATKQKVGYVLVYGPYHNWTQTGIERLGPGRWGFRP